MYANLIEDVAYEEQITDKTKLSVPINVTFDRLTNVVSQCLFQDMIATFPPSIKHVVIDPGVFVYKETSSNSFPLHLIAILTVAICLTIIISFGLRARKEYN